MICSPSAIIPSGASEAVRKQASDIGFVHSLMGARLVDGSPGINTSRWASKTQLPALGNSTCILTTCMLLRISAFREKLAAGQTDCTEQRNTITRATPEGLNGQTNTGLQMASSDDRAQRKAPRNFRLLGGRQHSNNAE